MVERQHVGRAPASLRKHRRNYRVYVGRGHTRYRAQTGAVLTRPSSQACRHTSSIGRISGAGLYYVVDLVDGNQKPVIPIDRYTGFQGDLSRHPNNVVATTCMEHGVFLGGFVPNSIKCGPPFTIVESEIDLAMTALSAALKKVEELYH